MSFSLLILAVIVGLGILVVGVGVVIVRELRRLFVHDLGRVAHRFVQMFEVNLQLDPLPAQIVDQFLQRGWNG